MELKYHTRNIKLYIYDIIYNIIFVENYLKLEIENFYCVVSCVLYLCEVNSLNIFNLAYFDQVNSKRKIKSANVKNITDNNEPWLKIAKHTVFRRSFQLPTNNRFSNLNKIHLTVTNSNNNSNLPSINNSNNLLSQYFHHTSQNCRLDPPCKKYNDLGQEYKDCPQGSDKIDKVTCYNCKQDEPPAKYCGWLKFPESIKKATQIKYLH